MSESDQVKHVIIAYRTLTKVIRSSWGPGYTIKPERLADVQEAQRETEAEVAGLDPFSLTPEDQTQLRKAKEEYLARTDPEIERERRMAGGREV